MASMSFSGRRIPSTSGTFSLWGRGRNSRQPWISGAPLICRSSAVSSSWEASSDRINRLTAMPTFSHRFTAPRS